MGAPPRNPKDSMVSTWSQDSSNWTWKHHLLSRLDKWSSSDPNEFPVFKKTDPVRWANQWAMNRWVITHALWPVALQRLYCYYAGQNLHPIALVVLYFMAFQLNSLHQVRVLRQMAKEIGFFDGDKHPRDKVPDVGVGKVLFGLYATLSSRTIFSTFLAYRRDDPVSLSWWLPAELFLYSIILDFFFYVYHRACHEVSGLWQYHRTHHLTKHPNMLLSAYADHEQEFIEMALIPMLTYGSLKLMGFPMGFYDWWVCHQFLIFSEAIGHSGLRIASPAPGVSSPVLQLFDAELFIEDHDLHHRQGWRKSCNYGKQTRLWDRLFGTCGQRFESGLDNVDYKNLVEIPWY